MEIITLRIEASGSAGSATGSTTSSRPVIGDISTVVIDYDASAPATTDVTIAQIGAGAHPILTVTNNATDGAYYPRALACGLDGAALTGVYDEVPVCGYVTASIAGSDSGKGATVILFVD